MFGAPRNLKQHSLVPHRRIHARGEVARAGEVLPQHDRRLAASQRLEGVLRPGPFHFTADARRHARAFVDEPHGRARLDGERQVHGAFDWSFALGAHHGLGVAFRGERILEAVNALAELKEVVVLAGAQPEALSQVRFRNRRVPGEDYLAHAQDRRGFSAPARWRIAAKLDVVLELEAVGVVGLPNHARRKALGHIEAADPDLIGAIFQIHRIHQPGALGDVLAKREARGGFGLLRD